MLIRKSERYACREMITGHCVAGDEISTWITVAGSLALKKIASGQCAERSVQDMVEWMIAKGGTWTWNIVVVSE